MTSTWISTFGKVPNSITEPATAVVLENAGRGYVLDTGRITHSGTASELLASDAIRAAYLGI